MRSIATLLLLIWLSLSHSVMADEAPKGVAVLIGADQYDKFTNLKYCGRDAADLGRLLQGEYDFRVTVLNQELAKTRPDLGPDSRRVRDTLKHAVSQCSEGDTLVIAYSGHGKQQPDKAELELTFADSDSEDDSSFLKLTELYDLMSKCKAKQKLLVLDACRKETSRDRVEDLNSDPSKAGALMEIPSPPEGVLVVLSCTKGEVSLESPVFGHGLFSHFFLTEWRAKAAKGEDVSVINLVKACVDPTRTWAKNRTGTPQTPQVMAGKNASVSFTPRGGEQLRKGLEHFRARKFKEAELAFTRGLLEGRSARLYSERANARLRRGYLSLAEDDAREGVRLAPNYPPAMLARADCFYEKGDVKESLAESERAIKLDPTYASAYLSRAAAKFELGEFHEAHDDVAHALRLAPDDLDTLLWKIDSDDMLYYDDKAIERARKLLKERPDAIEAMMTLSSLVENLGDRKEAERLLNEAIRITTQRLKDDPTNLSVKLTRANAYRKLRKFVEAEAEADEVLSIEANFGAAHRLMCDIHADRNEHKEAVQAGGRLIAAYPGFSTSYLYRAREHRRNFDDDAAMSDIDLGLKIAPNSPFLLWEKARLQESKKEYDAALASYSRVVSLYPGMWYGYVERAHGANAAGDHERAMSDLLKAVELAPTNPLAVSELGDQYHNLGRLEEALAMYSRALKASPTSTYAYISRGWVYYAQKEYAKATEDFRKATEADPDDPRNYSPLGMSLFQEKRYAEAIEPLTRAIDGNSDSASVFWFRGRARLLMGETNLMMDDFRIASKLTPPDREDADTDLYYLLLLDSIRAENTERFDRYVRSDPENVFFYYLRAQILTRLGKFKEAQANADAIMKLEPKSPLGQLIRARVYLVQKNQTDSAIRELDSARKLAPASGNLLIELSEAYNQKGDEKKATALLNEAIKLDPKNKHAYRTRAIARYIRSEYDEAIADLNHYIELAPGDEDGYSFRGSAYRQRAARAKSLEEKNQDLDRAIADLTKSVELDPGNTRDYAERGGIYLSRNKLDEAERDFDLVVSREPKNEEAINLRGVTRFRADRFEQALQDFDLATKLNPKKAIHHENSGHALTKLKKFNEAITALQKALEIEPMEEQTKDILVEALQGRLATEKKAERKLADLNQLITLRPNEVKFRLARAKLRIEAKEDKLAEDDLGIAVKSAGSDALPLATRVIFYLDRGREKAANDDLVTLRNARLSYSGNSQSDEELLAAAISKFTAREDEDSLTALDRLIEHRPKVGGLYWLRAWVRRSLDQTDQALEDLNRAEQLNFVRLELFNDRVWLLNERGKGKDFEMALADTERALKIDPKSVDAAREKLFALMKLERYDEVVTRATDWLKAEPKQTAAFLYRGRAAMAQKRYDAARADFQQLVESDDDAETGHYWMGSLLREEKKYDEALKSLNRAIEIDDEVGKYFLERGKVYRELKQFDRAEDDFERVARLVPKSAVPHLELARVSLARKNFGTALDRVEEGIKKKPEFVECYELRAEIHTALGEPEKAKADREKVSALKGKK